MDIWGEKPDDIYAVGFADSSNVGLGDVRFGIMMHFDGIKWSRVKIEFTEGYLGGIKKGGEASDNYYIYNVKQRKNQVLEDTAKYIEYNGKKFNTIHSDIDGSDHWHNITILNYDVIFTIDDGIYTYKNNSFNLITKNPYEKKYQAVYGRNKKDIIWTMSDGLTHYNGTNFEYILNFDQKSLSDGFVFENEVFFVANDFYNNNANNLIYHGVLK